MESTLNKEFNFERPPIWEIIDTKARARNILFVFVSSLFIYPAVTIISLLFLLQLNNLFNLEYTMLANVLAPVFGALVTIFFASNGIKKDVNIKDWLNLRRFHLGHLFKGAFIGIILWLCIQIALSLFVVVFNVEISSSNTSQQLSSTIGVESILLSFLVTPIIIPIFEELLFRGLLRNLFLKLFIKPTRQAHIIAIVCSSVLFSALHYQGHSSFTDLAPLFATFVVGVVNSVLVIKYKSIYPAIASHSAYNFVTILL